MNSVCQGEPTTFLAAGINGMCGLYKTTSRGLIKRGSDGVDDGVVAKIGFRKHSSVCVLAYAPAILFDLASGFTLATTVLIIATLISWIFIKQTLAHSKYTFSNTKR
jgi:hypothetical protein